MSYVCMFVGEEDEHVLEALREEGLDGLFFADLDLSDRATFDRILGLPAAACDTVHTALAALRKANARTRTIGEYTCLKTLGDGDCHRVELCLDAKGEQVVVKFLKQDKWRPCAHPDYEVYNSIAHEQSILARLPAHAHIMRFVDSGRMVSGILARGHSRIE